MNSSSRKIVVFASCGGGNLLALIRSQEEYNFQISLLVVDRPCGAIEKAKENSIPFILLDKRKLKDKFFPEVEKVVPSDTELIVLAGFMPIVSSDFCQKWKKRIINVHPSLLPKFGGKGMYGVRVHEAVIQSGAKVTGCTVHYVDEGVDTGEIILQSELLVNPGESAWELGGRVHFEENRVLPMAVDSVLNNLRN